jgi:ABC-type transporter Mla subunit MlaD
MVGKVLGEVTSTVDTATDAVSNIAEKVLDTGKATVEETKQLASAVLENKGQVSKDIADIADQALQTGQAALEDTKRLAKTVLEKL